MSAPVIVVSAEELARIVEDAVRRAIAERPANEAPSTPEWLDRVEVAELLNVHPDTVRRLVGLPVHRVGRRLRYCRAEVDAWVRENALARGR